MEVQVNYKIDRDWILRNRANLVTALRYPICVVLLVVILFHSDWTPTIIFLTIAAYLTDMLDGFLARWLGIVTEFGGKMDRLADKFLLFDLFILLVKDGRIHISLKIITVPMAVVETALLVYLLMGWKKRLDVSTPKPKKGRGPGQIKMLMVSVTILLCLLNIIVEEHWGREYHLLATIFLNSMFVVSLFFAVKSFLANRAKYRMQLAKSPAK